MTRTIISCLNPIITYSPSTTSITSDYVILDPAVSLTTIPTYAADHTSCVFVYSIDITSTSGGDLSLVTASLSPDATNPTSVDF